MGLAIRLLLPLLILVGCSTFKEGKECKVECLGCEAKKITMTCKARTDIENKKENKDE